MERPVAPGHVERAPRPRRDRLELCLTLIVLGLVAWVYFHGLTRQVHRLTHHEPIGYYSLQADAFRSGQLHLKIPTDPKLLELENPYAGPQGTSRPHDTSFYEGRFYLYYGATPVLLVYLPWQLLTGTHLHDAAGTVLLLYGGFLLAALWLWRLRRERFPDVSPFWLPALVMLLGLGAPLAVEAGNITFYAVPIAGAFFCLMVAFTAVDQSLRPSNRGRQARWLAISSLAWGLAVGARPIHVAGLLVLAVTIAWLWWQSREDRWRWQGLRLWVAGVLPAAMIGVAIMAYNYLRFDHPLEFGIRFSMASADIREARLVGAEFIPKNLHLYLLQPAEWIRYYPFILTNGRAYGVLPYLPFVVVALALPFTWRRPRLRNPRWILTTGTLVGAGVANLALLCLFFGGEERYLLDFAPPILLAAAATALAFVPEGPSRLGARFLPGGLAVLIGYGLFTGTMLSLPRRAASPGQLWLERQLNRPATWLERIADVRYGPVELEVRFPAGRTGTVEPLLVTGHLNGTGDLITVHYLDDRHIAFGAFHLGDGGPRSEPIEIDFSPAHRIRIELGSLYPIAGHEAWSGWDATEIERLRRRLLVSLNGQVVLQGNVAVYSSLAQGVRMGRNDLAADVAQPRFTGQVLAVDRPGWDRAVPDPTPGGSGPMRLRLRLPAPMNENPLPLLSTGRPGAGDTVFVQRVGPAQLIFGHDNAGAGSIVSTPVSFVPGVEQVLEIEMGSLYPPDDEIEAAYRRRLRLTFNGEAVFDTSRPFNPSTARDVVVGYNSAGTSSASTFFPGTIHQIERISAAPLDAAEPEWGAVNMTLQFPTHRERGPEPILVTGHTGRADVLFVTYEPGGHIRFGHDHWSIGVHSGDAFPAPPGHVHQVEIHSGALLPSAEHPGWQRHASDNGDAVRAQLVVRVDGVIVLRSPFAPYSNASGELYIGTNTIGASTCAPSFGGQITDVERLEW
jgi:hypothetical protein